MIMVILRISLVKRLTDVEEASAAVRFFGINSFTSEGISPFIRFVCGRGELQPIFGQTTPEQFIVVLDASDGHFIGNLSLLAEFVAGIQLEPHDHGAVRFRQRTKERFARKAGSAH